MNSSCQQQPFLQSLSYLLRGLCHPTGKENYSQSLGLQRGPSQHRQRDRLHGPRQLRREPAGAGSAQAGAAERDSAARHLRHEPRRDAAPRRCHRGAERPFPGPSSGARGGRAPTRLDLGTEERPAGRPSLLPAAKRRRDAPGARLTLKTTPAMVVPVLRAAGSRCPFWTSSASRREFLQHRARSGAGQGRPPAAAPAAARAQSRRPARASPSTVVEAEAAARRLQHGDRRHLIAPAGTGDAC